MHILLWFSLISLQVEANLNQELERPNMEKSEQEH